MHKIYPYIIIFILLTSLRTSAQEEMSVDIINDKMSAMFDKNDWYQLISYGEKAVKKGYDFFFLRARLGIAYYETENYYKAIPNLERALEIGYDNASVLEDLYYCYLFTGREDDRNYVFKKLPKNKRKRLKPLENPFADNLHIEYGTDISNDADKNSSVDLDGSENFYGEQTLTGNELYFNVGLNQLPVNFLNAKFDFSYLKTNKTKQIMFGNELISDDYPEYQSRFYNSYNIRISPGFIVSPAGQYIGKKYSTVYADYDSTAFYSKDSVKYFYSISEQEKLLNNFVLSLDISKYITKFKFGLNGSFSYLNDQHQYQYGFSFRVFPFREPNFFSYTNVILHNQNDIANLIVDQSFGGNVKYKFFYELFATFGKMSNYNEHNGFRVYNNDVINYKFGFETKYFFTDNFSGKFIYSYQSRERNYMTGSSNAVSSNNPDDTFQSGQLNYQVNNFLFGLNYSF